MEQPDRLARIFGSDAELSSPDIAARTSQRRFVRGRTQLAVLNEARNPSGHILSAWEAYKAYDIDVLDEAVEFGSAILARSPDAIGSSINSRLKGLGLSLARVEGRLGVPKEKLEAVVSNDFTRASIDDAEKIAFRLGLDERRIAFRPNAAGDERIASRLRTLQTARPAQGVSRLNIGTVLTFAEAASVIRTQYEMQEWLGIKGRAMDFEPYPSYGSATSPAWQVGYWLAEQARRPLALGTSPIPSMRALTEEALGIPVVQAELPAEIAGATIVSPYQDRQEVRGVVLNVKGANDNPWARRATLAHELGHLLYDPEQELQMVRVDTYEGIESDPADVKSDFVEQRANAFAIAFLAPVEQVRETIIPPIRMDDLIQIMDLFGISYTAARYHLHNAWFRQYELPAGRPDIHPSDEWRAAENFAIDYFPIADTPITRKGRFAGFVVACLDQNLLSPQSAANYLNCDESSLELARQSIRELYPVQ